MLIDCQWVDRYGWLAGLHDQDLTVQVAHGRATLTGTVDTWLDRQQPAGEAHDAGAHEVTNHLRVLSLPFSTDQAPASHEIEA